MKLTIFIFKAFSFLLCFWQECPCHNFPRQVHKIACKGRIFLLFIMKPFKCEYQTEGTIGLHF